MSSRARTSRLGRRLGLLAGAGLVLAATTGCTAKEAFLFNIPEPGTEQAQEMSSLWTGAWVAAWPIGVLVWGLIIFCVIVYSRRHRKEMPTQTAYNLPIEVMYTVAPLVLIFGLFVFTARTQSDVQSLEEPQDNTIEVVGFRWSWAFNYVEEDVYDVGTPDAMPTLWVPVHELTRFQLTSPDVVHSFWIPSWLYKLDVIPGKLNQFQTTPIVEGDFAGRCAELCGVDHSRMLFRVKVVPRAEFDAHMAQLREIGQTGQLETGRANRSGEPGPEGKAS